MKNILAILFLSIISSLIGMTQTTGDFVLNVTFSQADYNVNRNLYFHVPTDYDENQLYKLVVGFRGGPHSNAGQFRDQLRFLSDSLDAIILCPENSSHFNNNEGLVKKLFNYSVDTAMAMYNIDPAYIYLTGLSYGGRHAVIVAMDTESGPIPEIRGVIPFAAGANSDAQPDYEDIADFPPACICIGLSDNSNFIEISRQLNQDILANDGTVMLNEIPGVGHTVVFLTYPNEMKECLDFIESQYSSVKVSFSLAEVGISLSPNPADHLLFLNRAENNHVDEMYITHTDGRLVKSISVSSNDVAVSELPNGTYFFIVKVGGYMYAEQFVVLR
jgi:hypothetical protein